MPRPGEEESWVQHTPDYSTERKQASPASAGSSAIYAVAFTGMPGNIKVVQVEAPNKEDALLKAMRKEWGVTKIDITCLR